MTLFNTIIAIAATVSLFIFSLKGFSKELQHLGAERLKKWLSRITANRMFGFLLGALLTALIQSSSAVTSITVGLVDSGIISFFNSLSVLVGANLGTTFTAWLVAFKLDNLGSILLVIAMVVSFIPGKIHLIGKSFFYLGLLLFSLQQINIVLKPLSGDADVIKWMAQADFIPVGVLAGTIVTAVLQSSSVTTGLSIVLVSQGVLSVQGAIAVVVGCNLGTTTTAIIASLSLSKTAKSVAVANVLLNLAGLLVFLPFIKPLTTFIQGLESETTYQVATAHLVFNLIVAAIALPLLTPFSKLVLRVTGNGSVQ
ncbi:MAG: Na/Pi cotransporter family protein [Chitinophagales bacterium]|nr:Na/Pi cotransporter family protein [Chitinophagales bacterium]